MSRRAALQHAARWALRDANADADTPPPAAPEMRATLDDPALAAALAQAAEFGRLSDGDVHALRDARRRTIASGAAIALVAVIGIGSWQQGWLSPRPITLHFETTRGQRLNVEIADGSTLQLNGATSLDVTLDADQRLVELKQGEAYFDVAHEAKRPFVVHAGESGTRVLGTAFDIDLGRGEVKIAVYRGRVRFGGYGAASGVTVPAGWRTRFSGGVARAPTRFDAAQQDWRQDWLDTDEMRLGELVDALNRRGGRLVQAPPASLANIALSGRFKLDNPQQLLGAIGAAYGFAVIPHGAELGLEPTASDGANPSSK